MVQNLYGSGVTYVIRNGVVQGKKPALCGNLIIDGPGATVEQMISVVCSNTSGYVVFKNQIEVPICLIDAILVISITDEDKPRNKLIVFVECYGLSLVFDGVPVAKYHLHLKYSRIMLGRFVKVVCKRAQRVVLLPQLSHMDKLRCESIKLNILNIPRGKYGRITQTNTIKLLCDIGKCVTIICESKARISGKSAKDIYFNMCAASGLTDNECKVLNSVQSIEDVRLTGKGYTHNMFIDTATRVLSLEYIKCYKILKQESKHWSHSPNTLKLIKLLYSIIGKIISL